MGFGLYVHMDFTRSKQTSKWGCTPYEVFGPWTGGPGLSRRRRVPNGSKFLNLAKAQISLFFSQIGPKSIKIKNEAFRKLGPGLARLMRPFL